ncbi:MAG TPA: hypothetical protein VH475_25155 [Tepidisphaeraceae bacterium]
MRRFAHILVGAATALSAALCVAILVIWARSYVVADNLVWTTRDATVYAAGWTRGCLQLTRAIPDPSAFVETEDSLASSKPPAGFEHQRADPSAPDTWGLPGGPPPARDWRLMGVRYRAGRIFFYDARALLLPLWLLLIASALLPALCAWRWRVARARRRASHCRHCGYDLRATPDRCPECGQKPGLT